MPVAFRARIATGQSVSGVGITSDEIIAAGLFLHYES